MDNLKIVALLPMKGHSERVPNKNLKSFGGIPLYHAVVKTLMNSKFISYVVINTDSDNIKDDIKSNFPELIIHDRPEEIQGDFVPMNDIIKYDMSLFDADIYLQTHSTNPLLTTETLDSAIEYFLNNKTEYDSLFSVTPMQTRLYWEDGKPVNHNPNELLRTQDLPTLLEENSNFYIFTKSSFANSDGKRIGINPYLFSTNPKESLDIDTKEDFEIAEIVYKSKNQHTLD